MKRKKSSEIEILNEECIILGYKVQNYLKEWNQLFEQRQNNLKQRHSTELEQAHARLKQAINRGDLLKVEWKLWETRTTLHEKREEIQRIKDSYKAEKEAAIATARRGTRTRKRQRA